MYTQGSSTTLNQKLGMTCEALQSNASLITFRPLVAYKNDDQPNFVIRGRILHTLASMYVKSPLAFDIRL